MDQEIVKADPFRRRRAFGALGAGVVLGAIIIQSIVPYATEVIKRWPPERAIWAMGAVLIVGFLSLVPVGVYIHRIGARVVASGRYPAPGMAVLVDTRVIKGHPAASFGLVFQALGLVIAVGGTLGTVYVVFLLLQLARR